MWEIAVKGKFVTGTTMYDEEKAKETCNQLLQDLLVKAGIIGEEGASGLFQWVP